MISIGQLAALIAAIGFAILMLALSYVVLRLGKTVDATTRTVEGITDKALPLPKELVGKPYDDPLVKQAYLA